MAMERREYDVLVFVVGFINMGRPSIQPAIESVLDAIEEEYKGRIVHLGMNIRPMAMGHRYELDGKEMEHDQITAILYEFVRDKLDIAPQDTFPVQMGGTLLGHAHRRLRYGPTSYEMMRRVRERLKPYH